MATKSCPCCGDPMQTENVVCWVCYRATNRLAPGVHPDPDGTTATDQGYAITITKAQIAEWDRARDERVRQAEFAELVAERELEADPFPRG